MNPHDDEPLDTPARLQVGLWRRLFGHALAYPRDLVTFAGAGLTVAAADVAFPLVTRRLVDDLPSGTVQERLPVYVAAYLVLAAVIGLSVRVFVRKGGQLRTRISRDIRDRAFTRLQELSFSFYDRRSSGWILARMTSDCDRLANILAWGTLDLVWGTAFLGLLAGVMLVLSPGLALWTLAVLPLLALISVLFERRLLKSSREVRRHNGRLTSFLGEGLAGVRVTKLFRQEGARATAFGELAGEMEAASVRNGLQAAAYLPMVTVLGSLAAAVALHRGGIRVEAGDLSLGTLLAFLGYAAMFFQPIQDMAAWFAELQMAQAAAERVLGLLDEVPSIQDGPDATPAGPVETLELRDVGFAYADGPEALSDVNLTVRAGETVALVGSTGAGKSTLVNLVARFYEPTRGALLLDGVDARERTLESWRRQLGVVLQTPGLFRGTLAENLRYGAPEAEDERLVEVLRELGAGALLERLEGGLEADVGQAGARLSSGERQLVACARVLLADPRVLILDEATSAMDTETEGHFQRALERVLRGRTAFVIAHRLSTIRGADRILVVEGGRVIEEGTHAELLRRGGRYRALVRRQALTESGRDASAWGGEGNPVAVPGT